MLYELLFFGFSFTKMSNNNNNKENKPDRKEDRRQKLNRKYSNKDNLLNDDIPRTGYIKRELRKIKEEVDEEEWEDWDRYYNH